MTTKNNDNMQFARVANADGTSPLGAAAVNSGLAPLCDAHGRAIVVAPGAGISANMQVRTYTGDGLSPDGAQPSGTLQPALCDPHGRLLIAPWEGGLSRVDTPNVYINIGTAPSVYITSVGLRGLRVTKLWASNPTASNLWLQIYDLNSSPPNPAVDIPCMPAIWMPQNGSNFVIDIPDGGIDLLIGLVIAWSTVAGVYQNAGGLAGHYSVFFRWGAPE